MVLRAPVAAAVAVPALLRVPRPPLPAAALVLAAVDLELAAGKGLAVEVGRDVHVPRVLVLHVLVVDLPLEIGGLHGQVDVVDARQLVRLPQPRAARDSNRSDRQAG